MLAKSKKIRENHKNLPPVDLDLTC